MKLLPVPVVMAALLLAACGPAPSGALGAAPSGTGTSSHAAAQPTQAPVRSSYGGLVSSFSSDFIYSRSVSSIGTGFARPCRTVVQQGTSRFWRHVHGLSGIGTRWHYRDDLIGYDLRGRPG